MVDGGAAPVSLPGGEPGTADQRERLLLAALDVIAERGFPETRIGDVAERAGVSPALVIYYFKTKDRLLTEALRYSEDGWYALGRRRMAAATSAAARLEQVVMLTCLPSAADVVAGSWSLWLDLWAEAARRPELGQVRREFDQRWRALIREIVDEGERSGEFRPLDAADFAVTLSALLDGFAIQIALADPVVRPQDAYRLAMTYAAEVLGFGWRPDPPSRPRRGAGRSAGRRPRGRRHPG